MSGFSRWLRGVGPILLVAATIVALDQWTKSLVRAHIPDYTYIVPVPALGEYLLFEHVHNYGAAFGILQNQTALFVLVAIAATIAIVVYGHRLPLQARLVRLLLGLMLGGALGNLIDRLTQTDANGGYVTDFIKVGIPGVYYFANFNIADSAIVVGVIGLGIYVIWEDWRQQRAGKLNPALDPEAAPEQ